MNKELVVAVILARGGSKGIPSKNLIEFCGKPLMYWTVTQCLETKSIDEVWVSSDSQEILSISSSLGAKTILRPNNISTDSSTSESGWKHAIEHIEEEGKSISLVIAPQVTSPLRDRFGVVLRLDYYNSKDLFKILNRSAEILEVEIDDAGGMELAKRSRGTPRIANRILKRTRDYAQVKADGKINKSIANESLKALGIDKFGLDGMDRTILSTLIDKFEGGPVGVNSLSVAVSEDASTIEDVYEPYLIKQGFIQRTNRGRIAQEKAYKLFNKTITNKQQGLFK